MTSILSTKKLAENQRQLLLHADCSLVEYDAIKIEIINFEKPELVENAIITSQNAVLSILNSELRILNCFCVGIKTKNLLQKSGFNVVECSEYAENLADLLIQKYNNRKFHFFCGNLRSDEIPLKLKENKIHFEEIQVYNTTMNPNKFEREFDAVLFFSPSGVKSFWEVNKVFSVNPVSVCIGKTTAAEAEKYTNKVVIANSTTIESVIAKAVNTLKKK